MISANTIAEVAGLFGDVARASILTALMGGRALTAGELARLAGVTAQTASGHLAKLLETGLVAVEKQGRHRYYRLASADVAEAMQALMVVAAAAPARHHPVGPRDKALRLARTCYDHMAGRLAVALADTLSDKGFISLAEGAGIVTDEGHRFFCDFGLALAPAKKGSRPLCRTCLDWSERRPHLGGRLGAELLSRCLDLGWVARMPEGRALSVSRKGEAGFSGLFGLPDGWQDEVTQPAGS
ncbi:ArsR/SmtB family transcription factor [Ectorhizobium quercum]